MADSTQQEVITQFMSLASCDADFATSFLEANGWNLELAVQSLYGDAGGAAAGGGGFGGGGGGGGGGAGLGAGDLAALGGFGDGDDVRAPMAQFSDTLVGVDPAARPAHRRPPPQSAANHPLEAFRDFRTGSSPSGGDEDDTAAGGGGDGAIFGLPKRAKNLSEIYRPPTEICFVGSFEELRLTGRQQSRWLLVNIQSPTEFASQQLNADTWTDEGLRAVLGSSFLLWQRYFDSEEGATYCRHYLREDATFPHIGLLDPVTGQLVKSWHGFTAAERCGRG